MTSDVWIGAITTLAGALIGGTISFILSRQQAKDAQRQREVEAAREERRLSAERRFQSYSEFLTRARSFRNAVEAYYSNSRHKPQIAELNALLQAANDASALVFLVVESRETREGCRNVLRALWRARETLHSSHWQRVKDPWKELDMLLGRTTREFQNAARNELGVKGPTEPWDTSALDIRETSAVASVPARGVG